MSTNNPNKNMKRLTQRIKKLIDDTERALAWDIKYERDDGKWAEAYMVSNDVKPEHIITLPNPENNFRRPFRWLDQLHELVHALMNEQFRPALRSLPQQTEHDKQRLLAIMYPVLTMAEDWFVSGWLMKKIPDAETLNILNSWETVHQLVLSGEIQPNLRQCLWASLVLARRKRHLGEPVPHADRIGPYGFIVGPLTDAFLAVTPDALSMEKLECLINRLLDELSKLPKGTLHPDVTFRIKALMVNGVACWDYVEQGGATA